MGLISYLKILRHTFKRDLKGILSLRYTDAAMKECTRRQLTVPKMFHENAIKYPSKVIFQHMDAKYTYQDMDIMSNQVANVMKKNGLKVGDEIAIFMTTNPEYVAVWLGLAKGAMIASLINTNHRLSALEHSLTSVSTKAIIYDGVQADAVKEILPLIKEMNIKLFHFGRQPKDGLENSVNIDLTDKDIDKNFDIVPTKFGDRLLYVHTSGTTGLPKAAIIKNSRFMWVGYGVRRTLGLHLDKDNQEVIYTCLPLYHLASGVLASSQAIMFGTKVAIDSKFSASNYWRQAIRYDATIGQYIGELCRYLLSQTPSEDEKNHKMRKMFGNGVRINIWDEFKTRFNINQLVEIYGATEGNVSTTNIDNHKGACGFIVQSIPRFIMRRIYPIALIKVDPTNGVPKRDAKTGLCIETAPGEVGMFVGRIVNDPVRAYDGYTSRDASEKKIISDVFEKGDKCFASGDLLKMDIFGYLYFVDRTGDTFRWKGENISTTQLENVISNICNKCCVVYGVSVTGYEGKCGMVAIEDDKMEVSVETLLIEMKKVIPKYSIPIFVRIVSKLEMTPTMKLKKTGLVEDSYHVYDKMASDIFYVLNKNQTKYSILDNDLYEKIYSGKYNL